MLLEDLGGLIAHLSDAFELVHPLDLRRPAGLLTSDAFLRTAPWRLPWPWQPPAGDIGGDGDGAWRRHFRSIAVVGLTLARRGNPTQS